MLLVWVVGYYWVGMAGYIWFTPLVGCFVVTFGSGQLRVLSWAWVLVSIFGVSEECDCGFVFGMG